MLPTLLLLPVLAVSAGEFEDAAAKLRALVESARPRYVIDPARGAWYRKVTGAKGYVGLEAWGVLPRPSFDPARAKHVPVAGEPAHAAGPLDRPDVYLGLHAESAEVDCGLIWDQVHDAAGRGTGRYAYRVYWRTSKGGWGNPAPGAADDLYLEPGERFALTLTAEPAGRARLAVRRAGRRAAAAYVFDVPGLLASDGTLKPLSFKRVHSIDQFRLDARGARRGNEGRPALPTRTRLEGGRWEGRTCSRPTARAGRWPAASRRSREGPTRPGATTRSSRRPASGPAAPRRWWFCLLDPKLL
ncbi:MAG: hypothetical protein M0D55_12885 [Elusimicrobiota bacterium]|nr:MAG: hypothetical protein M0D55_12885 [Elusimicrobiota bacterium]